MREAEVEDFDAAVRGQEHVLRLEVAMDDAAPVREGEAVGDGARDRGGLTPGQRRAGQPRAQRFAVEELGHRERDRRGRDPSA